MKIVVLDGFRANPGDLSWDGVSRFGEFINYDRTEDEDILTRIDDAEVVLTNKTPLTRETMEMLRKEIEYYRTEAKIVVLTANAVDGVKKELIDAGFDDYLAKPIIYSELEKVLKQYIPEENFEIG